MFGFGEIDLKFLFGLLRYDLRVVCKNDPTWKSLSEYIVLKFNILDKDLLKAFVFQHSCLSDQSIKENYQNRSIV